MWRKLEIESTHDDDEDDYDVYEGTLSPEC